MSDTTVEALFAAAANGDAEARHQIFAAVYNELRRLAERELRRRGSALPISPTTLLHEAYLDFAARTGISFPDRGRFMAYASRAMRGLIIDHARARMTQKRGGGLKVFSLPTDAPQGEVDDAEVAAVGDALEDLAQRDSQLAELVDLKFFCGLTLGEIAALRGVSERTAQRDWEKARLYLYQTMRSAQLR